MKVLQRHLSCLCLGFVFLLVVCGAATCQETEKATIDYARITVGGSISLQNDIVISDSITLYQGSDIQVGEKYEIVPVKLLGNNGIATAIGARTANIDWVSSSESTITGYTIMRGPTAEGPWETIAVLDNTVTEYLDMGLEPSSVYYYKVLVNYSDGSSEDLTGPLRCETHPEISTPHGMKDTWSHYE